jgi:hypothetical protein
MAILGGEGHGFCRGIQPQRRHASVGGPAAAARWNRAQEEGVSEKVDAKVFASYQESRKSRGELNTDPEVRRPFADWADDYLATKRPEVAPGTYENLRGRIRGYRFAP